MAELKGSRTEQNLKEAFASESQANRRYLFFAKQAESQGYADIANLFRAAADDETGHAHGHLEYLKSSGDPATGMPLAVVSQLLQSALASETQDYIEKYPAMARIAREEGFEEIATWFDTLARAERTQAGKFQRALDAL